jgi:hypothetical protein
VDAMVALPAFHLDNHQCFWASLTNPAIERPHLGGTCYPLAVRKGSHSAIFCWIFTVVFVFVLLYFWAYLLYHSPHVHPCNGVWIFVTQYTFQITFSGDPGFVASVSQANGPTSPEVLPSHTFVLRFFLELHNPYCVFFYLVVICLSRIYIKKKN